MPTFMQALVESYDMNEIDMPAFLDLHTGQIVVDDEAISDEKIIDWDDEESDERYIALPEKDSREEFEWMEEFTHILSHEKKQNALFKALNRKKPFRNFKDEIIDQDVRQEWFVYHDIKVRELMFDWLISNEISIGEMEYLRQKQSS